MGQSALQRDNAQSKKLETEHMKNVLQQWRHPPTRNANGPVADQPPPPPPPPPSYQQCMKDDDYDSTQ